MSIAVTRPQRWDVPFGDRMTPSIVDLLLEMPPFSKMDPKRFTRNASLHDILLNDTRITIYQPGDLIVREGDYGSSAFMILSGDVRVTLDSLPDEMLGHAKPKRRSLLGTLRQMVMGTTYPEIRQYGQAKLDSSIGQRTEGEAVHIFLQDVPGVLDEYNTLHLVAGELFGEVSALARTPRSATIFAEKKTQVLEIRWQGLRELMRKDPALNQHVTELYRLNSLQSHLRATPLLKNLDSAALAEVVRSAEFESYGEFSWNAKYQKMKSADLEEKLNAEPIICDEEHYSNGLFMIRAGFARLSRRYGHGHRTLAYLGKGQLYGLDELIHNWKNDADPVPLYRTLRAIGYVDVLRIPTWVMEQHVLPSLPQKTIDDALQSVAKMQKQRGSRELVDLQSDLNTSTVDARLLEFIVENRLMNGEQTMIIDTDRCTRCDDCVRACAVSHDNNPRFIRHGPTHGNLMFANACMHCADPVCMIGCPTGAIGRDEDSGNVLINDMTCIGCSTCANSCPYHNIRMVEVRSEEGPFILDKDSGTPIVKATKCDLCVENWGGPACQRACPHDALVRMDMNDLPRFTEWLAR